jgi:hypothetical protein
MTITTRIQTTTRLFIATLAIAGVSLGLASAPTADAAGLRNCVDITGPQSGRVACYEDVWADGEQVRMTFSNVTFEGAAPRELDAFYVIAPQTAAPQGWPPNTFAHDHVVRDVPAQNQGGYSVQLQGFFVLCWTSVGGPDPVPFATTVNGRPLTSSGAIESAAEAGLVALINLGPGAVIVGTISGK